MAKFRVYAKTFKYYYQDVEASTASEAMTIAEGVKGNFSIDADNSSDDKSYLEICKATRID